MGYGSDAGSRASMPAPAQRGVARRTAAASEDAMLALREECLRAKQQEQTAEAKSRHLAAQLMRTEEAAKRILTRTDPSARGGVARHLLEAERQLVGVTAELAEARSELGIAKRQATDGKRQAAELKKRLEGALSEQRRLALQLGRLQAGSRYSRGLCGSAVAPQVPPAAGREDYSSCAVAADAGQPGDAGVLQAVGGAEAEAAATARLFAEQQERLVAAQERSRRLEQQLQQREVLLRQQTGELSGLRAQLAAAGHHQTARNASNNNGSRCQPFWPAPSPRPNTSSACRQQPHSHGTTSDDGSEDVSRLRLSYLKSRSAVESLAASNTRLLLELESARAHIRQLAAPGGSSGTTQAEPLQPGLLADSFWGSEQGGVGGSGSGGVVGVASASTAAAVQLRQELAAANHRAACLQVELDAAQASLAIYQAAQEAGGGNGRQAHFPVQQHAEQQQRRPRDFRNALLHAPNCSSSSATGNLTLQLLSAQLEAAVLGTVAGRGRGRTFVTVDVPGVDTAVSRLAEGPSPQYNATLHFPAAVSCSPAVNPSTTAHVEVHCCAGAGCGSSVDYTTLAAGELPLGRLLAPGGAWQHGQCRLYATQGGAACGHLEYAVCRT